MKLNAVPGMEQWLNLLLPKNRLERLPLRIGKQMSVPAFETLAAKLESDVEVAGGELLE